MVQSTAGRHPEPEIARRRSQNRHTDSTRTFTLPHTSLPPSVTTLGQNIHPVLTRHFGLHLELATNVYAALPGQWISHKPTVSGSARALDPRALPPHAHSLAARAHAHEARPSAHRSTMAHRLSGWSAWSMAESHALSITCGSAHSRVGCRRGGLAHTGRVAWVGG